MTVSSMPKHEEQGPPSADEEMISWLSFLMYVGFLIYVGFLMYVGFLASVERF